MKHIKLSEATTVRSNENPIETKEFTFGDDAPLNDALITLNGRYPKEDFAVNTISTALISVESGQGRIGDQKEIIELSEGDRIMIHPNEAYFFETNEAMTIRYIATPPWTNEQASLVSERN